MSPAIHGENPMTTQEIEIDVVPAASSATDKALEERPPRMEIPLPGGSGDEHVSSVSTETSNPLPDPVEEPSLVVVRSPDPPGGTG
jgi:hypothetical protein